MARNQQNHNQQPQQQQHQSAVPVSEEGTKEQLRLYYQQQHQKQLQQQHNANRGPVQEYDQSQSSASVPQQNSHIPSANNAGVDVNRTQHMDPNSRMHVPVPRHAQPVPEFTNFKDYVAESTLSSILPGTIAKEGMKSKELLRRSVGKGSQSNINDPVAPSQELSKVLQSLNDESPGTEYLTDNIIDRYRIFDLHNVVGSRLKLTDGAAKLISEAVQMHAMNILEQCTTVSRRRRHVSLMASYNHICESLRNTKGQPEMQTRNNLALKFGVDSRLVLQSEDARIRTQVQIRTKAWEAEIVDDLKKDLKRREEERNNMTNRLAGGISRKRGAATTESIGPTTAELRWDADMTAETNGQLTWQEIASLHFRDKVASVHKLGPYATLSSTPVCSTTDTAGHDDENSRKKAKLNSGDAMVAGSDVKNPVDTSKMDVVDVPVTSAVKPISMPPPVLPTPTQAPSTKTPGTAQNPLQNNPTNANWNPPPCPIGYNTADIISEDDAKNVLSKYISVHPKCNGPLPHTMSLGKTFNRGARFGLGYHHTSGLKQQTKVNDAKSTVPLAKATKPVSVKPTARRVNGKANQNVGASKTQISVSSQQQAPSDNAPQASVQAQVNIPSSVQPPQPRPSPMQLMEQQQKEEQMQYHRQIQ